MVLRGVGALLADEMGLGKTVTVLAVIERMRERFSGFRCLVVMPLSLIPNWQREMERFSPTVRVFVQHGPTRALQPQGAGRTCHGCDLDDIRHPCR